MEENMVLVTGASGYIATHVVQQLQKAGYKVRGTVRSLKNEEKVKPLRNLFPEAKYPVELVEADLTDAKCWKAAVSGCKYVIHVASPVIVEHPADEDEVIKPAVEGTLNVLQACKEANTVQRVVVTSSVAAVCATIDSDDHIYTEEDWTNLERKGISAYVKSKTLAEKAAWDFVHNLRNEEKFELVTVNPSYVIGPVLCGSLTASMVIPKRMMERQMPMLPNLNMSCVDVRDVAEAHVAALTNPEAVGKRHILSTGSLWFSEMAHLLVKEFGHQGYNIPTRVVPYPLLWLYAWFDKSVNYILPSIGRVKNFNNDRMQYVLGVKPKPIEESFIDMCYSMIEGGKIKKTAGYKGVPK